MDVVGATEATAAAADDVVVVVVVDSCALAESFLAFFLLLTFGDSTEAATESFVAAAAVTVVGFSWLSVTAGFGISTVVAVTTGAADFDDAIVTSFFATAVAATGCFDLEF